MRQFRLICIAAMTVAAFVLVCSASTASYFHGINFYLLFPFLTLLLCWSLWRSGRTLQNLTKDWRSCCGAIGLLLGNASALPYYAFWFTFWGLDILLHTVRFFGFSTTRVNAQPLSDLFSVCLVVDGFGTLRLS
jgi:hypothetical protein